VLVTGETGTGKELAVRAIHRLSTRFNGPLIAINCAALPESLIESELFGHEKGAFTGALERREGCFERAQGGTILLDEIAEMPIGTQAKLLRILDDTSVRHLGGKIQIPVDVRVIAATNRDPGDSVRSDRLREDLYYRLNVFHISLPALRDHKEDIPAIAEALIADANRKHNCQVMDVHPAALDRLQSHNWPGNVRELRNVLERATVLAAQGTILVEHLHLMPQPIKSLVTDHVVTGPPLGDVLQVPVGSRLREIEKAYILMTLKYAKNNKRRAAAILGMSARTLQNRLAEFYAQEAKTASAA